MKIGYPDEFLDFLKNYHFTSSVRTMAEGEIVFANEPLVQVDGPLIDAQLVETALLNFVNYQTLIATKASRIRNVAGTDPLLEFGSRRAQEVDAALWGTRAAYIGGFNATSNVKAGELFGIPVSGTHAHSLVQAFGNDYDAFKAYASTHKDSVFLVDTFDTLRSGVPAAIKVANEMKDKTNFLGVRIDSGDMAYLSKKVREQLDNAGFENAKIYASNNLDEKAIMNLKMQKAKIDVWGVGTKLITGYDQPALGAVYKMVAMVDENGQLRETIKLSNNAEKISTPGKKQVWRITRKCDGKSEGDYVALSDENPRKKDSLYMFHPKYTYINKNVKSFQARPLLRTIFDKGKLVYLQPNLNRIREFSKNELGKLWAEYKRQLNPQEYPVDLSTSLYQHRVNLINHIRQSVQ
jgi:nicotinate phosphoribosyltransferase